MASSTPPHFFKVILSHTLTQQMLEVPIEFVRKYGEALEAEEISLNVVNGAIWKIGLKKINKKIWLEKGWDEFVKFYSIDNGYFVVFKYEGNYCFQVLIFDQTATGVDYPTYPSSEFKNKNVSENEEIKMKVKREREEFEENAQILPLSTDDPKRMKRRSDEASGSKANCKSHEVKKNIEDFHISNLELEVENKVKLCLKKKEASKFKSKIKHPSFLVTMSSSYLHTGRNNMCIPSKFGNKHLKQINELTLQVSNCGKAWEVKCVQRTHTNDTRRFEMGKGWKSFSRENNLKVGDVCVFELIKNIQISFNVTIFRLGL